MNFRNNADFQRFDMSKSQRNRHHRKLKLDKRDWYKQLQKDLMNEIRRSK